MPEPALLVEHSAEGVLCLRLNRPERRNALATPLLQEIAATLDRAGADDAIRSVLIVGGPTVFAAGADLDELAAAGSDDPIESPRFAAWKRIRAFEKPLIAGVEGWCLGAGAELAMCCDLIVAGATARFGQPETNRGIIPGAGGTATLARLVGRRLATRMVLTGEPISAAEAFSAGLISDVAEEGQAEQRAMQLAVKIATRAPAAMRAAKASIRDATIQSEEDHLLKERRRFVALLGTADKAEGIAAFREKRAPTWRGI